MGYEFDIFYYLNIIKLWRKQIITVVCASVILSFVYIALKPDVYVSSVSLLLPGEASSGGGVGLSSLGRFLDLSGYSGSSNKDVIIAVLNSGRMSKDIREQFKSYDKPLWWRIETYPVTAGLSVEIRGPSPALTEKIANFCIENLDKINNDLNITPSKPMVRVLDAATYGSPIDKKVFAKTAAAGMFSFLAFCSYLFIWDFIKKWVKKKK